MAQNWVGNWLGTWIGRWLGSLLGGGPAVEVARQFFQAEAQATRILECDAIVERVFEREAKT